MEVELMADEFIEIVVAVPVRLHIKKVPGGGGQFLGPIDTYHGKLSIGSISEITTFSTNSAEEAAWKVAHRLAGVLG
jgi:hypothetical protein